MKNLFNYLKLILSMGFVDSKKAQSTTEYLAIVVVIIVIAIAAITLFVSVFEGGSQNPNLSSIQSKQYWSTQTIALADAMVDENGDAVFVLTNNTDYALRMTGYKVDENEFTISGSGITFKPKEQKAIFFPDIGGCASNGGCAYDKILFYYSPLTQTQKLISGGEALVLGKRDNVKWNFEGTNNMVCVAQGEVLGTCSAGAGTTDTNTQSIGWTNSSGEWLIDLNTSGNLKADGNYLCDSNACYRISDLNSGGSGLANPVTIDLNLFKTNPEVRLSNSTSNLFSRWNKASINNQMNLFNQANKVGGLGGAIRLNADGSGINVARGTFPNTITGDWSVSVWLYRRGNSGANATIFELGSLTAGTGFGVWCQNDQIGYRTPNQYSPNVATVALNTWEHWVVTQTGTTINFYKNGNSTPVATVTGRTAPTAATAAAVGMRTEYPGYTFNGDIDELAVWGRTLSTSEISTLYGTGLGLYGDASVSPFNSGLIAGYHADEGTGLDIADFSGNSRTLTANAMYAWTAGKVSFPSTAYEYQLIKSVDGTSAGLGAINTFGDGTLAQNSTTQIDGVQGINLQIQGTTKAIISSDGNFGIGTTTPQNKLNVIGDGNFYSTTSDSLTVVRGAGYDGLEINTGNTENYVGYYLNVNGAASSNLVNVGTIFSIGNGGISYGTNNLTGYTIGGNSITNKITSWANDRVPLGIWRRSGSTLPYFSITSSAWESNGNADILQVAADGNVGIGTATPTQKLDVNGNINESGNLTHTGTSVSDFNISNTDVNKNINLVINKNGTQTTALKVDGTYGTVTMPLQSYVLATRSVSQTIPNGGTPTDVVFDNEINDTLNEYNNSTGIFTAKTAGVYMVVSTLTWKNISASGHNVIVVGGAGSYGSKFAAFTPAATEAYHWLENSNIVYLAVGGTIKITAYQDCPGSRDIVGDDFIGNETMLAITKLS